MGDIRINIEAGIGWDIGGDEVDELLDCNGELLDVKVRVDGIEVLWK